MFSQKPRTVNQPIQNNTVSKPWFPTTTIVCALCDIEFTTEKDYNCHRRGRDHERAETEKRRLWLEEEQKKRANTQQAASKPANQVAVKLEPNTDQSRTSSQVVSASATSAASEVSAASPSKPRDPVSIRVNATMTPKPKPAAQDWGSPPRKIPRTTAVEATVPKPPAPKPNPVQKIIPKPAAQDWGQPPSRSTKPPAVQTPAPKPPAVQTTAPKPPAVQTPAPKPPAVQTPAPKPPAVQTTAPKPPAVQTPAPKPPAVQAPAPKPPAVQTPAPKPPAVQAPAPKPPAVQAPAPKPPAPKPPAVQTPAPKPPAHGLLPIKSPKPKIVQATSPNLRTNLSAVSEPAVGKGLIPGFHKPQVMPPTQPTTKQPPPASQPKSAAPAFIPLSSPSTSGGTGPSSASNIQASPSSEPTEHIFNLQQLPWADSEGASMGPAISRTAPMADPITEILKDPDVHWCPICNMDEEDADKLERTPAALRKHMSQRSHHQIFEGLKLILGSEYLKCLFPLWTPLPTSDDAHGDNEERDSVIKLEEDPAPGEDTGELAEIQQYLDNHQGPLLGLGHITENHQEGQEDRYYCELCNKTFTLFTVMDHIVARDHRENYLKKKHPSHYERFMKFAEGAETDEAKIEELTRIGVILEEEEGRKRVRVATDPRSFADNNVPVVIEEAKIQHELDEESAPLLGLEYLVEYSMEGFEERYVCDLCDRNMAKDKIIIHLTSLLHRQAYVKKHHQSYHQKFLNFVASSSKMPFAEKEKQMGVYAKEILNNSDRKLVKNGGVNPEYFYNHCCRMKQADGTWANFFPARPVIPASQTQNPAGAPPAKKKQKQNPKRPIELSVPPETDDFTKGVGYPEDVFREKLLQAEKARDDLMSAMQTQVKWSRELEEVYRLCILEVYQTQPSCTLCRRSWKEPLEYLLHIGGKYHAQMQGDHYYYMKRPESNISVLVNCRYLSNKHEMTEFGAMVQKWHDGVNSRKRCTKVDCRDQFELPGDKGRSHWQQFVHPPIMSPVIPPS